MKKIGGTHIGFVLSFVIFITFIVIIYSVLIVPNVKQSDKRAIIDNLRVKLLENVTNEITIISINTNSAPQNCVKISGFLSNFNVSSKIITKDGSGISQTTYVLGDDLEISRNSNETFFKIYESEEFDTANDNGETPCNPRSYETGSVKKEKYIFEKNIINLMRYYNESYELLGKSLGFPEDSDFDFGFTYSNGTYIKVERQTSSSIYSVEIPIQYTDNNADIVSGLINIRTW